MKRQFKSIIIFMLSVIMLLTACGKTEPDISSSQEQTPPVDITPNLKAVTTNTKKATLVEGLSAVSYDEDYKFDEFLESGGASSDADVIKFLGKNLISDLAGLSFLGNGFGCSTISAKNTEGNALFGRNFDWEECTALIVTSKPTDSYASISTVNLDFLTGYSSIFAKLPEKTQTLAALYAPLDGMNEEGLCVAVLVIEDSAIINQATEKPDLTTTTAVRMLLDKAATVDEALELLGQYDMHSSMNMMIHFALADKNGRSVVVEYVDNEMVVTETPVVTNFYIAEGTKNGIGSGQSHERYNILIDTLKNTPIMDMDMVRDALDSVSKDNFEEFTSTEWSIIYDQTKGEARYYHRENYEDGFTFSLK